MLHVIKETFTDSLLTLPLLFLCYLLLSFLNHRSKAKKVNFKKLNKIGPIIGASVGLIPQCGFSAAAATLYNEKAILGGTLIAVFFATSDEALPVLLTDFSAFKYILPLFVLKFLFGCGFGFLLNLTLFKNDPLLENTEKEVAFDSCENEEHHKEHKEHHHKNHSYLHLIKHALEHTLKTALFIFITMLVINFISHELSHQFLEGILLKGSLASPFITAAVGLIPGCSISVLITELLIKGSINFSAAFAGLSAGAGFGFVALFKNKNKKSALKIIVVCYFVSALSGLALALFGI